MAGNLRPKSVVRVKKGTPMCTFKYCKKSGKCFLAETSPCRDHDYEASWQDDERKASGMHERSPLRYNGFIEPAPVYETAFEPESYWRLPQSPAKGPRVTR